MPLRNRLLAPLACALVSVLAAGLLTLAPTAAEAATKGGLVHRQTKGDKASQRTVFPRSSYLCYGYQDCKDAGMGNAGYAAANDKMYWRMYSGHNCTNYAAYRMVHSGLPNTRPWSGGGNAMYWGTSMPKITNGTPTVGAVAWWKANTGPAGSVGHVAYVEQVVSADEVIVSQDSWGGDFSWAVITRSSGNWPSGFIHFNDVTMVNKKAPVISGTTKVGGTLTATAGSWKPGDVKVSYQWYADGKAVKRGKQATYVLGGARLGATMTVKTTATKMGYATTSVTSAATSSVLPGQITNTTAPVLGGVAQVDQTLSVDTGAWNPTPDSVSVQWNADGVPITGATGATLALGPDLVGQQITATVTARRDSYDDVVVTTTPSAAVAPGTFTVTREPSVLGVAKPGQTLRLDPGLFKPVDAGVQVQWLRDGVPVLNATGDTYFVSGLDLGSRISAQVTLTRAGYETSVRTSLETTRVKATPKLALTREKLSHRVKLTVDVTAPDVPQVDGAVLVKVQGGFRQEVTLTNGRAKLSVSGLPRGKRTVTLVFLGSDTVERTVKTSALWMPAPKGSGKGS
ncbi:CHAP domain-containing protein [Nocardioides mangrovi]|uniref:CHAP domain-containing protein n=1 Tax=Nocardioides mangrovi TaxID=2874580 RepID=A0ABS7UFU7_9ACTN|nr:CHAP domain-containing protein [Nocardioides mangrovi]MBZ5739898.1 CHAP domain-containing protein [Nocardioides mangrovi]